MKRSPRPLPSGESGTVLVLAVIVIFAILALVALVVDLGLVRLSQVQMQTAVDSASLAGLQERDAIPDPLEADLRRRGEARDRISRVFDDDFSGDPEELEEDALDLGAGPVISLSGGSTILNASQLVTAEASVPFDPRIALNEVNEVHGDIVSGTYIFGQPAVESSTYERFDFIASEGPLESAGAPALLVRIRRTDGRNPLDRVDGVSSSGPSIPLLFGLGSNVLPTPEDGYDVRSDGLTVRATSIATSSSARSVGNPSPDLGLPGRAPFAMQIDAWEVLVEGRDETLDLQPDGTLTGGGVQVGFVTAQGFDLGATLTVGGSFEPPVADVAFLPVVATLGGAPRIIGFGRVRYALSSESVVVVTRLLPRMESINATSWFGASLSQLDSATRAAVLDAHRGFESGVLVATVAR